MDLPQRDWRAGENPAAWKGNLQHALAPRSKVARVQHNAALPWKRLSGVLDRLALPEGMAALAVHFIAFTAARSGEARRTRWSEINVDGRVWTVPAERMKGRRENRVPLCPEAIDVLDPARRRGAGGELVFPGGRAKRPLSDVAVSKALHLAAGTRAATVHGLRSTFRDWIADATSHQPDVAEAAVAHALGDAVRAAYQRGDLFEKCRVLVEEWGLFIIAT